MGGFVSRADGGWGRVVSREASTVVRRLPLTLPPGGRLWARWLSSFIWISAFGSTFGLIFFSLSSRDETPRLGGSAPFGRSLSSVSEDRVASVDEVGLLPNIAVAERLY